MSQSNQTFAIFNGRKRWHNAIRILSTISIDIFSSKPKWFHNVLKTLKLEQTILFQTSCTGVLFCPWTITAKNIICNCFIQTWRWRITHSKIVPSKCLFIPSVFHRKAWSYQLERSFNLFYRMWNDIFLPSVSETNHLNVFNRATW